MNSFLEQLNESQRKAVEYIDGAQLVIAGAGSGKTRVLTYKIAYLMTQGLMPWEIMALTFTNKAAKEMKERIATIVGENARYLQMGTFHSVFARILRNEAEHIGFNSNYTIYDESDSRSLCGMIIKQLELDEKVYKKADIHCRISNAKNHLISPSAYAANATFAAMDAASRTTEMPTIYKMYVDNCRKANAMDFDDLLVNTYELFKNHEDIRKKYVERFKYILVDEYQDTNHAQQQIIWQLTKERQKVCVVGDDAQSIYAFRGANIDNILDFQHIYNGCKLHKLEQNYRSTQRIVEAANSLIRHNNRQIKKDVYSKNDRGDNLVLRMLTSDKEEAISVCKDIKQSVRRGEAKWNDFAILYRTNSQSRTFEQQMLKDDIPYKIFGGMSFYQRKEIKDILAYFRLVINPNDDEAFRRAIKYPSKGIGETTVNKLVAASQSYGVSIWQVSVSPQSFGVNVNKGTISKISDFVGKITGFTSRLATDDAYQLGCDIIKETGIAADIYTGNNPEDLSRRENLEEMQNSMQEFVEDGQEEDNSVTLIDYLQEVSLLSDKESSADDDNNRVSMMTVHSAKGLEFPEVFIVGMEENIFPSPLSTESMRELEEERRLLYVAITRAEKRCVMTCAKSRFRYGRMEFDAPSRFLRDIDPALMNVEDCTRVNFSLDDKPEFMQGGMNGGFGRSNNGYGNRYGNGQYTQRRMQNSNPVASQFMADKKPKITSVQSEYKPQNRPTLPPGFTRVKPQSHQTGGSGSSDLKVGDIVQHDRFGIGEVKGLEGNGANAKATIEFRNIGTKQLMLKFAKLKKM